MKSEMMMEKSEHMDVRDEVVSMLDSYIENPKLVTPETLSDLKDKVMEAFDMDGMDEDQDMEKDHDQGGLMITIGKAAKKKSMEDKY